MKRIYDLFLSGLVLMLLSSCIQDEPLNRERDIQSFVIDSDYYISTPSISIGAITILMANGADLTNLTPIIKVPEGATVQPASGVAQDFSKGPVSYTVTAENTDFKLNYLVSVTTPSLMPLKFDFETWKMNDYYGYYDLMTYSGTELMKLWESGNSGVRILNVSVYPTRPSDTPHSGNHAALLETRYGGIKWGTLNIPILSGSLFYGEFTTDLEDPRKSLKLGHRHFRESGKPTLFTGHYKYTPGSPFVYLDNGVEVRTEDIADQFSLYSLLFKVKKGDPDNEYLDGIMVADDKRIIARAEWKKENAPSIETEAANGYKRFAIPYEYTGEFDYDNYDYKLVILFASSKEGNLYRGAIGSTLLVDDVEVISEPFEE